MNDLRQDALTETEAQRLADAWVDRARKTAAGQLSLERMRQAGANKRCGRVVDLATVTLVGEEPK